MPELPRGTITFLFTDIEGSTRLLKQLGERYGIARADHNRICRAAFEEHSGHEIDTQGDAFFVAFTRAKDAVAAAAAAQRALATHEWPDGAELRVRMGIHTGEPSVSEEGYLGLGVHRAARICSAGHGGQVLVSEATVALLQDEELADMELRDLGLHQLKDIDRAERIYQLVLPDLPNSFPPLKAPQSQPDETPFEGRAGELAEAAQAAVAALPWYRRRIAVLSTGGAGLAVLIVVGALVFTGGSSALSELETDSVGLINAKSNEIKNQVTVGNGPNAVAVGGGAIWVAALDGTISRVDPDANLVTQTYPLDQTPSGIAFGENALWVTTNEDRSVRRISPTGTRIGEGIPVGNGPSGVAVGLGAVWVTNRFDDTVTKIPLGAGAPRAYPAGLTPSGVAIQGQAVWVSNAAAGTVSRLEPSSGALQTINVGNGPGAIAGGEGAVWVANGLDGTVSRIDPGSNSVAAVITVGRGPNGIAVGVGSAWVTNGDDGTVSRIDTETNRVSDPIEVGESPGGVALSGSGVWVSARGPLTNHRGGTLRLLGDEETFDFIDPAVAYTLGSWGTLTAVYDGLVTFRRVAGSDGAQLVPDLARSIPRAADGGRTYTFQLRQGIKYSNGEKVRASDIRRGLERFFKIHLLPPLFYTKVVGVQACIREPRRCDLARGVLADDSAGTITFHLTGPDPEFLYQLALPFASAVPGGTPARIATKRPIPGTGPYAIARSVPRKSVELVRNPHFREWSRAAQPDGFPDRIVWRFDVTPAAQVTSIERGRADWSGGRIPRDRLTELTTRYTEQLQVDSSPGTIFMFLNTRVPPFNVLGVRQALNYAVDRDAVVNLSLGRRLRQPSCQILPPNFPGYRPYCPYTRAAGKSGTWTGPDLAKARRLVAQSHTRGMAVRVWGFHDPGRGDFPFKAGRYFASLLTQLGYRTSLEVVRSGAGGSFATVSDSRRRAQIGFYGWAPDYPAASNFINALLSCASFRPATSGQVNVSEFCDRRIDADIKRALAVQANDPTAAGDLWAGIERRIVDLAPWVPLHSGKSVSLVSKRVGNYQYNPQWGTLLDQLWVR